MLTISQRRYLRRSDEDGTTAAQTTLVVELTSLEPQKMKAADVKEPLLRVPCVHFDLHFGSGDVLVAPRTALTTARTAEGL